MVKPAVGEVIYIALFSNKTIHQCHTGRLVIEGTYMHDLDTQAFLNRQELV